MVISKEDQEDIAKIVVTMKPWNHRGLTAPHSADSCTLLWAGGFGVQFGVSDIREHVHWKQQRGHALAYDVE